MRRNGPEAGLANMQKKAAGNNINLEELSICLRDHAKVSNKQANASASFIRRNEPVAGVKDPFAWEVGCIVCKVKLFERRPWHRRSRGCC